MRQDGYRLTLVLALGLFLLATLAVLAATGPSWWVAREVINTNEVANDFAPVTQGQLKHMAHHAWQELEESLPQFGGAGADVSNRVSELVPGGDFYPVNLGQLKYVAAPFYDRLMELEYTDEYPWTGAAETNDFAPANIGQVKNLFSFDLWTSGQDSDGDGIPDWWELMHFGGATNAVASTDDDEDGLDNAAEYQQRTDPFSLDTDDDGMSDGWEVAYGLNPFSGSDAMQDADDDGFLNLEEYVRATDPSVEDPSPPSGGVIAVRHYYDQDDRLIYTFEGTAECSTYQYSESHNLIHARTVRGEP